MALASLILGIVALIYGPFTFGLFSVILGWVGIIKGKAALQKTPELKKLAKSGIAVSKAALITGLIIMYCLERTCTF